MFGFSGDPGVGRILDLTVRDRVKDCCDSIASATYELLSGIEPLVVHVVFDTSPANPPDVVLVHTSEVGGTTAVQSPVDALWRLMTAATTRVGDVYKKMANVVPAKFFQ